MNIADSTSSLCSGTPSIRVVDNRGNLVRALQYNRTTAGQTVDELITRSTLSDDSLQSRLWDARLFTSLQTNASQPPNILGQLSLSGQSLRSDSVDAGWSVMLYDTEGQLAWAIDSRSTVTRTEFDTLGRPVAVFEQVDSEAERVSERFIYGDNDATTPTPQNNNLRGQLIRHYDEAGLIVFPGFTLLGAASASTQQLLADAEQESDWQGSDESVWKQALSTETYVSACQYDAVSAPLVQTDAKGNQQRFSYDVAGAQCQGFLTLAGGAEQALLTSITYSAAGHTLQETAGNGVVTNYSYEPQTQRLLGVTTTRPASGTRSTVLQDLQYQYDPVGNILSISNANEVTRYFRNQAVAAQNTYSYDALYQLLGASGRENASAPQQGPGLPDVIDTSNVVNYTRSYTYDRGGNLYNIAHAGASTYTNALFVDAGSNRALAQDINKSITQDNINSYFDLRGNVKQMQPGTPLTWNGRNQLQSVVLLDRGGAADANDREVYQYRGSTRIRKQTRCETNVTSNIWQIDDVIYLPGLELRTSSIDSNGTVSTGEALQVITISASGRAQIRVLHWDSGKPDDIANDQFRYSFDNQIRSVMLEVDGSANILTIEEYYPYGGTAILAAQCTSESKYKINRYSGKERDGAGLYYYGYRYYAPWLCRWMNPDPAGMVDGANIYCMVKNNPILYWDGWGANCEKIKLGRYQRKVGTFEKNRLILMDAVRALKIEKFDYTKNKFKSTNDFDIVRVGGDLDYMFTYEELRKTLRFYGKEYTRAMYGFRHYNSADDLSASRQDKALSVSENLYLGLKVAEYTQQDADIAEPKSGNLESEMGKIEKSVFVLMPRGDKRSGNSDRYKRVIGVATATYDQWAGKVSIGNLVAHPYTQAYRAGMTDEQVGRMGSYNQVQQFNIRGLGKFATLKLLKEYFKSVPVKSFVTEAINPRSAAIAIKFGMKYDGGGG